MELLQNRLVLNKKHKYCLVFFRRTNINSVANVEMSCQIDAHLNGRFVGNILNFAGSGDIQVIKIGDFNFQWIHNRDSSKRSSVELIANTMLQHGRFLNR